jgi:hypothetical protein
LCVNKQDCTAGSFRFTGDIYDYCPACFNAKRKKKKQKLPTGWTFKVNGMEQVAKK